MGVGRNREQARRDQQERDRQNRQLREQARREAGPGPRKFSWQTEPGKFSWQGRTAGPDGGHRYQSCKDEHCERFPCRVYREGFADGHAAGYSTGYADGYAQGFPDGIAACPGPHSGG
jgi:hypothetical protein